MIGIPDRRAVLICLETGGARNFSNLLAPFAITDEMFFRKRKTPK
jgi:hypothetical protein